MEQAEILKYILMVMIVICIIIIMLETLHFSIIYCIQNNITEMIN